MGALCELSRSRALRLDFESEKAEWIIEAKSSMPAKNKTFNSSPVDTYD